MPKQRYFLLMQQFQVVARLDHWSRKSIDLLEAQVLTKQQKILPWLVLDKLLQSIERILNDCEVLDGEKVVGKTKSVSEFIFSYLNNPRSIIILIQLFQWEKAWAFSVQISYLLRLRRGQCKSRSSKQTCQQRISHCVHVYYSGFKKDEDCWFSVSCTILLL